MSDERIMSSWGNAALFMAILRETRSALVETQTVAVLVLYHRDPLHYRHLIRYAHLGITPEDFR